MFLMEIENLVRLSLYYKNNLKKTIKLSKYNCSCIPLELLIPPNGNVYYAISTAHDLNFVLRSRRGNTTTTTTTSVGEEERGGRRRDASKARRKLLGLAL